MKSIKIFLVACTLFAMSSVVISAQDMKNMPMHNMKNMKHEKAIKIDSTIVHKGEIGLKAIDKNKDGKVFQDQMDWNVISDKPGKCPLCKMTLKEVTVKEAKENLIKNGFKVK